MSPLGQVRVTHLEFYYRSEYCILSLIRTVDFYTDFEFIPNLLLILLYRNRFWSDFKKATFISSCAVLGSMPVVLVYWICNLNALLSLTNIQYFLFIVGWEGLESMGKEMWLVFFFFS